MQFPLIDVLRAVAALLVLVYHVLTLGEWQFFSSSLWGLPFRLGWIGVDLFLVISGFVITLSAARESGKHLQGFARRFMERRLRRLVPLYLLTCVVFVFLVRPEILTGPAVNLMIQVASHALFLQNLSPYTHGVINGVTWSLALEMQFYLALVFGIGYLLKLGSWRSLLLLVGLSWVYLAFGDVPAMAGLLYDIKPAVTAIVRRPPTALARGCSKTAGCEALRLPRLLVFTF